MSTENCNQPTSRKRNRSDLESDEEQLSSKKRKICLIDPKKLESFLLNQLEANNTISKKELRAKTEIHFSLQEKSLKKNDMFNQSIAKIVQIVQSKQTTTKTIDDDETKMIDKKESEKNDKCNTIHDNKIDNKISDEEKEILKKSNTNDKQISDNDKEKKKKRRKKKKKKEKKSNTNDNDNMDEQSNMIDNANEDETKKKTSNTNDSQSDKNGKKKKSNTTDNDENSDEEKIKKSSTIDDKNKSKTKDKKRDGIEWKCKQYRKLLRAVGLGKQKIYKELKDKEFKEQIRMMKNIFEENDVEYKKISDSQIAKISEEYETQRDLKELNMSVKKNESNGKRKRNSVNYVYEKRKFGSDDDESELEEEEESDFEPDDSVEEVDGDEDYEDDE